LCRPRKAFCKRRASGRDLDVASKDFFGLPGRELQPLAPEAAPLTAAASRAQPRASAPGYCN